MTEIRSPRGPDRREFLSSMGALPLAALLLQGGRDLPPVRRLTRGPRHHWFGYYDKLEVDPAGRRVLGMAVDFEHRSPRPDDVIEIGCVVLDEDDRWVRLGESRAWCWQQGCMLQWVPGPEGRVVWNDSEEGRFVCRILDTASRKVRTLPRPVYALSPDGKAALGLDFARLDVMRPGYGYKGVEDPCHDDPAPATSGIWRVDLESGESRLLVSLADVVAQAGQDVRLEGAKSYVNHILWNPDGTRFVFLHRWRVGRGGFSTRMLTAARDGSDLRLIDGSGHTSHFIWRDPAHLLLWTRPSGEKAGFYLVTDEKEPRWEPVGAAVMTENGHCTYLPARGGWILNDTYPDRERLQHPYLFHVPTGRRVPLGHFRSPPAYRGEWRCDTHPRATPDGRHVIIDSPHGGDGRQLWMIDASAIVA